MAGERPRGYRGALSAAAVLERAVTAEDLSRMSQLVDQHVLDQSIESTRWARSNGQTMLGRRAW